MNVRRMFVFLHDVVAAGVAWSAAFWLRFNLDIPPEHIDMLVSRLPFVNKDLVFATMTSAILVHSNSNATNVDLANLIAFTTALTLVVHVAFRVTVPPVAVT